MPLNQDQRTKIQAHVQRYLGASTCPVCNTFGGTCSIADQLVVCLEFIPPHTVGYEHILPLAQVICDKCGYVRMFVAQACGVAI
jgi:hypothetical protein